MLHQRVKGEALRRQFRLAADANNFWSARDLCLDIVRKLRDTVGVGGVTR